MRNMLLVAVICALPATLNAAGKCDEAKTFLESNKSALDALKKEKKPEHQGRGRGRSRRAGNRMTGIYISRTITLLEGEIARTSGQNEKRCERYKNLLDGALKKQGSGNGGGGDCSAFNNDKVKCSSAKVNNKPCEYKEDTKTCVAGS